MSPRVEASDQLSWDQVSGGGGRRDHRGVHREPGALLALEGGGEALGAAQDVRGADGAVRGEGAARGDLRDGGGLVDDDAEAFACGGQALDQLQGVDAGSVRGPGGAHGVRDVDAGAGVGGVVELAVRFAEGEFGGVEGPEAGELGGGAGHFEDSAAVDVGVDAFLGRGVDDFGDGLVHGVLEALGGLVAVEGGVAVAAGDAVVEPAAVAAGGSVAAELLLQDGDAQVGGGGLEVVRGPQAGVAAADDDDVGRGVAGERGAGWVCGGGLVRRVPEGNSAVDRHGGVGTRRFGWVSRGVTSGFGG